MKLFEMEGFLRGKCIPGDLKVNETNAEYLVRKLNKINELTAAHSTLEKAREVTNCPDGVELQEHLKQLVSSTCLSKQWKPEFCPITGRRFFMWIEHPELGNVPTYGGPFDSYTIPTKDSNGEFNCERYDHDSGDWADSEYVGVQIVSDEEEIVTDSILREAEARGVEKLKEHLNEWMAVMNVPSDMQFEYSEFISACDEFATQLREGEA
ncbi:hypothetical protein DBY68_019275 [Pseudocitrobacter sp. RIT415]|uniref:hypothetical protein n=1 Tax=Pseudocitrobacter sp. RIT415 TaxID=2202163 RepID=UPI000D3A57C0|nr:hypothetical protein [Pseudocitrobacter sp. RIT 415]RAU43945.1 hypothetical protein DBY68_019275 [Pseudocitrobacter sp. RIT 415]